jgi:uncharacterized membrane protein
VTTPARIELEKEFSGRLTIHMNVGQEVVVTTVDKVRICLMESRDCLTAQREWLTPGSLFLALVTTLAAAEFREFILKPSAWQALYVLGSLVTFVWSIVTAWRAWKNRGKASIEAIVATLKAQSPSAQAGAA